MIIVGLGILGLFIFAIVERICECIENTSNNKQKNKE